MVTSKTQYNLANAKEYFEEHLCVGDYYNEGQRVSGQWMGLGAAKLGLSGVVHADEFLRLCDNQHPGTGETLTQRFKTTRIEDGDEAVNRRIFFDFTFSPPKSVSLAAFIGRDERILKAHAKAMQLALREFEEFAATRIRLGGAQKDRFTGNLIAALFTHDTSRALDPHLHTHCILFNATHDPVEDRWKALQNYELLRAKKFVENAYYHELARDLRSFGYRIRNLARGDFQIEGIPNELCERFSKRDAQIDRALEKLLAEKPELRGTNIAELRARLAVKDRPRKQKDLSRDELQNLWQAQTSEAERNSLLQLSKPGSSGQGQRISLTEAVQWAEEHLFDRNSVVRECELWQQALERARGEDFFVADLKAYSQQRGYLRDDDHAGKVTLREILVRESNIIHFAKNGVGECHSLVERPGPLNPKLDDEQRRALNALLGSINRVSLFRGGAGTGKSFVLKELASQIQNSGRPVIVLAPQRQQVSDMEKAEFPSPTTLTSFLLKGEMPKRAVVVVDEAGLIGGRQMLELMQLVSGQNGRLVLSGDTRQHGAVEASDALLAIEQNSGIQPVELHSIRRQDPARARDAEERERIKQYRTAVEAAAAGRLDDSFRCLDRMGAVVECGFGEQADKLAQEYVRHFENQSSVVVVSQTWAEVHRVNSSVRDALKAKRLLGSEDTTVEVLDRQDLTNAQKRDSRFYSSDALIVFNQKVRDAKPGAKGKLAGIVKSAVLIEVDGKLISVSNRMLDKITVCRSREIAVAAGDRLHLKANRVMEGGGRVTNGELVTVKSVDSNGGIELTDGRVLDKQFREFLPGYAVTAYGSQGKTVDHVLFSDSTIKAATNAQQWYVTISRGRRGIQIFTPDKEQLRENLTRSGHRPLALDFLKHFREQEGVTLWQKLRGYLLRFGTDVADSICQLREAEQNQKPRHKHEHKITRMLGQ